MCLTSSGRTGGIWPWLLADDSETDGACDVAAVWGVVEEVDKLASAGLGRDLFRGSIMRGRGVVVLPSAGMFLGWPRILLLL